MSNQSSGFHRAVLACGNFFFRYRNGLFPVVFLVLLVLTRPALFLGRADLDALVSLLGVLAALAGQALRVAVIGFAYIKRGGQNRQIYADQLVAQGFYAHTRNPMYVGNFLMAAGLSVLHGSPWMYLFSIPFFAFVYGSIVAAEEVFLRAKFGPAFEDYARRVNRFVPNFRGLRASLQDFTYDWRLALTKEFGTVHATLLGLIVLRVWKDVYCFGFEARRAEIVVLLSLVPFLLAAYVALAILKKKRVFHRKRAGANAPAA